MDISKAIRERRSVREFTDEPVRDSDIEKILEAGRWAPSGKNTQPWRFIVVKSKEKREELAESSSRADMLRNAPVVIAVMFDREAGYHRDKDMQGIGACVQNMLLATHALGLGTVWVGGIIGEKQAEKVLGAKSSEELMLVLPIGHPVQRKRSSTRKELSELVREI